MTDENIAPVIEQPPTTDQPVPTENIVAAEIKPVETPVPVVEETKKDEPPVETKKTDDKKTLIEPFTPVEINTFNELSEFNNIYASLRLQEENYRASLQNVTNKKKDLTDGKIDITTLIVPFAGNILQRLKEDQKDFFINTTEQQRRQLENQLQAIIAQRERRQDELGEKRVHCLRILVRSLHNQHKMSLDEIKETAEDIIHPKVLVDEFPSLYDPLSIDNLKKSDELLKSTVEEVKI
jgi:hypothetical protein